MSPAAKIRTRTTGRAFRTRTTGRALLPLGLALAAACGPVGSSAPEDELDTAVAERAIVNGTTMTEPQMRGTGLAALYHFDPIQGRWFKRPCSATIIYSVGGSSLVMTARHCVTDDTEVTGNPLPASSVKILPAISAGLADPNPPVDAVTAASIFTHPSRVGVAGTNWDLAFVRVNADWSSRVSLRLGFYLGTPMSLPNTSIWAYGYGINVNDWSCQTTGDTVTNGAGIARISSPFTITFGNRVGDGGAYRHGNSNGADQKVICGDSGGPDIAAFGASGTIWYHLTGVHSGATASESLSTVVSALYAQNFLGGLLLSPLTAPTTVVGQQGNFAIGVTAGSSQQKRFVYRQDNRQIRTSSSTSSTCFGRGTRSDGTIGGVFASCTIATAQQWELAPDLRIRNVASGECLTYAAGGRLDLATCGTAVAQRFVFHVQP
jgi:hypothetical protein